MKRFKSLLLVVDTERDNTQALRRAIAVTRENQASLTICSVLETSSTEMRTATTGITSERLLELEVVGEGEQLEEIVATARESGVSAVAEVLVGRPFLEIIRVVLRNEHDLVIKCAESSEDLRSVLFGSTDMHLLRKCPCPVWIVKPSESQYYRRMLAAVDRDPEDTGTDVLSRQILEIASSLALLESSELHVVHAWQLLAEVHYERAGISEAEVGAIVAQETRERTRWLRNLVDMCSVTAYTNATDVSTPQLHVIKGHPKRVVSMTARELDVDVIVMGTVARTGIAGFFIGNTAESILNQIDCSVLTVKPPGFISPVELKPDHR